jgi:hypothetical protein
VAPESDKLFTPDQPEVILQWNAVGNLASDEEYAVRLQFTEKGNPGYGGDQTPLTAWAVRRDLFFERADPPDRRFKWFVYVQKKDGTQISPESEHRVFFWR